MSFLDTKNRGQKAFTPNSKILFTLNLGGKVRKGNVILKGNVVVSAGTTSGTVVGMGGPVNLISRIIVTATPAPGSAYPGGKIVDCDPRSLLVNSVFQRNGKLFADQGGSTLGNGAAGTYPVYLSIPIYFADAVQRNSLATALNLDGVYQSVQVEVDTASLAACFVGNDRTVDWSGLQVQWKDDRVGVTGDTAVLYQESHMLLIPATNSRILDDAMPRDGSFMSWQIVSEASASKTLSDALFNRIVSQGSTHDIDLYQQDILSAMLDDEWIDPSQTAIGIRFVDFTDGVVTANSAPAGQINTYLDVTNVSGANLDDLLIFTRRIFRPQTTNS